MKYKPDGCLIVTPCECNVVMDTWQQRINGYQGYVDAVGTWMYPPPPLALRKQQIRNEYLAPAPFLI